MKIRRVPLFVVLSVAALLLLAGCEITPIDPSLSAGALTTVANDTYGLAVAGTTITASAPSTNTSGNTRITFYKKADPTGEDMQSCATWSNTNNGSEQEGAALRNLTYISGSDAWTTSITVTKNIWLNNFAVFNVHTWDTSTPDKAQQIASFDLTSTFGTNGLGKAFPWRLCARVVGSVVTFIVWPTNETQPAWTDSTHGGSVTLPAGSPTTGAAGLYVGHITPGTTVAFSNPVVTKLPAGGSATATSGYEPTMPPVAPHPIPNLP